MAAAGLVFGLPACGGGGGGGGGGSVAGPTTPTRQIVTQQTWTADFGDVLQADVTITGSGAGTLDATVQWTFATNDVDLVATSTTCSPAAFITDACTLLAEASSTTAKPERISFSVTGGSSYRIWIVNFGPGAESGTLEVGLTR
jgi:hypothetical protein